MGISEEKLSNSGYPSNITIIRLSKELSVLITELITPMVPKQLNGCKVELDISTRFEVPGVKVRLIATQYHHMVCGSEINIDIPSILLYCDFSEEKEELESCKPMLESYLSELIIKFIRNVIANTSYDEWNRGLSDWR